MSLPRLCQHSNSRILFVTAAPKEAAAIAGVFDAPAPAPWRPVELAPWLDLVVSGVGKSNAAGATARFANPERHAYVLNVGIAGVLPGGNLKLLDAVVGRRSVFADEGVATSSGFTPMSGCGFPPGAPENGDGVPADERLILACGVTVVGAIATVSTCSGTDRLAAEVAARTGAAAEAMEGGAAGLAAWRAGLGFAEVRIISNTTGERTGQVWDLAGALAALSEWVARAAR